MTIREIISKFENDNARLVSENEMLKNENEMLKIERNSLEMELNSLKTLLDTEASEQKEKKTRRKKNISE